MSVCVCLDGVGGWAIVFSEIGCGFCVNVRCDFFADVDCGLLLTICTLIRINDLF